MLVRFRCYASIIVYKQDITSVFSLMTQTVLPQLKEIASDLAAQEASLIEKLAEVRDKLNGVRSVLPLFGEDAIADGAQTEKSEKVSVAKAGSSSTATSASKAKTKSARGRKTTQKSTAKTTTKKSPKATAKKTKVGKKKDGRTASWQKFTRPGVKEKTVPEAVRLVLETQPDKSFKIAEVMDSLFKEDMPKQQYLKARNRISNILSGGVRDGEWYKGDRGTYSLTAQ